MSRGGLFKSSIGKKLWMALTGLFLCVFLLGHLAGNLPLLFPGSKLAFNEYAHFMVTFPVVRVLSIVTFASILLHAVDGLMLALANKKARPVDYKAKDSAATWSSRNMAVLGSLVLFFIIVHLSNFWAYTHFDSTATLGFIQGCNLDPTLLDANGNKDLHAAVLCAFSSPVYVVLYILSLGALAFHLIHGFQSGFQTLGINHKRYTPVIKSVGFIFGIAIPILFAAIPIVIFVRSLSN